MESLCNSMADTFRAKRFLVRMRKLAGGEEDSGGVCSILLAALYCKRDHKSRDVDRARGNTLKSRYTCFFRAASPVAPKETTETHRTLGYASGKSIFGCSRNAHVRAVTRTAMQEELQDAKLLPVSLECAEKSTQMGEVEKAANDGVRLGGDEMKS
ncbi:hypothetical protein HPB47_000373 [Ixodes persulcatus]|uniref:Uncharacterized protein n=1 Tax=Ixodes persulcatus TaxID=34615 RepID=A0AC60PSD5_IXOPE|nr:hypothetical protein HPB47_000373 [Ixodes persulcatus]